MTKIKLTALEPDAYSDSEGDYWSEHPADLDVVEGLQVGDEYELTVALNGWTETYRVVKAPSTGFGGYEVERIPNPKHQYVTTAQAEAYANARVKEALEEAAKQCWLLQTNLDAGFEPEEKDKWLAIAEKRIRALIPEDNK